MIRLPSHGNGEGTPQHLVARLVTQFAPDVLIDKACGAYPIALGMGVNDKKQHQSGGAAQCPVNDGKSF